MDAGKLEAEEVTSPLTPNPEVPASFHLIGEVLPLLKVDASSNSGAKQDVLLPEG